MRVLVLAFLIGCSDNTRARQYGGTWTKALPCDKMLVNVTWKTDDLWVLTTDAPAGYTPRTYEFVEDSVNGVWEGTVIVTECSTKSSSEPPPEAPTATLLEGTGEYPPGE